MEYRSNINAVQAVSGGRHSQPFGTFYGLGRGRVSAVEAGEDTCQRYPNRLQGLRKGETGGGVGCGVWGVWGAGRSGCLSAGLETAYKAGLKIGGDLHAHIFSSARSNSPRAPGQSWFGGKCKGGPPRRGRGENVPPYSFLPLAGDANPCRLQPARTPPTGCVGRHRRHEPSLLHS